jgi:hypothetical protein
MKKMLNRYYIEKSISYIIDKCIEEDWIWDGVDERKITTIDQELLVRSLVDFFIQEREEQVEQEP